MKFPTPILGPIAKHNTRGDVYEPAEDTFLLLDAIEKLILNGALPLPTVCLEIGSGSGIVTAFMQARFPGSCFSIAVDISSIATQATVSTCEENYLLDVGTAPSPVPLLVDALCMDCTSHKFAARALFDLVLINPPYVETDEIEIPGARIWAGGPRGLGMLHDLIHPDKGSPMSHPSLEQLVSPQGSALIIMTACNQPEQFIESIPDDRHCCAYAVSQSSWKVSIVSKRRCGRELLYVMRFQRSL